MSATKLAQLEKEIGDESKLAELMQPIFERLNAPNEIGRRQISVNSWTITERHMSDGTSRVYISGCRVNMSYEAAIKSRCGGSRG